MHILWLTDVHHPALSGTHYPRSVEALERFELTMSSLPVTPSLIAISGDLVNRGSARKDDLLLFKETLDRWGYPYLVCPGNHDLAPAERYAKLYPGMEDMEACPLPETNFGQVFGPEGIRGIVEEEGYRFVSFALRDEDPDEQLDWLTQVLEKQVPTLVFGHYPVLPTRTGGFCENWGYERIGSVRERLKTILDTAPAQIVAYCCGHQHINSVVSTIGQGSSGVFVQIETGALGTSPYCYRWIHTDAEGISVSTEFLPGFDDWKREAMNPDKAFDAEHPDGESYYRGLPGEQEFRLPL